MPYCSLGHVARNSSLVSMGLLPDSSKHIDPKSTAHQFVMTGISAHLLARKRTSYRAQRQFATAVIISFRSGKRKREKKEKKSVSLSTDDDGFLTVAAAAAAAPKQPPPITEERERERVVREEDERAASAAIAAVAAAGPLPRLPPPLLPWPRCQVGPTLPGPVAPSPSPSTRCRSTTRRVRPPRRR